MSKFYKLDRPSHTDPLIRRPLVSGNGLEPVVVQTEAQVENQADAAGVDVNEPDDVVILKAAPAVSAEIFMTADGTAEINLAAGSDGKGTPRFALLAYNGGLIRPNTTPPLAHPVVVELAGIERTSKSIPALKDHDPKQHVGHTDTITIGDRDLKMTGVISGASMAATEVTGAARNGFNWPVSMGLALGKTDLIAAGRTVQVNGRDIAGPAYVVRKSKLREISFLTIAADENAVASIAAAAAESESNMDPFEKWLNANGFDSADKLPEKQKAKLEAAYKAETAVTLEPVAAAIAPKVEANASSVATLTASLEKLSGDLEAQRKESRNNVIRAKFGDKRATLAATAIEKNWSDDLIASEIKAADLQDRLGGVHINASGFEAGLDAGAVMEAGLAIHARLPNVDKAFDPKVLEAASKTYRGGIGLQEIILQAASHNGYRLRAGEKIGDGNYREIMRTAMQPMAMQAAAAFSTLSLPGIFSNTANKFALAGFTAVEDSWKKIASMRSVSDFKTITSYRLNGDMKYERVAPDGEIKHGSLSEESYTNKVQTYGKMFGLTRQDIINDDLGVLQSIPQRLGRGAALEMNLVFWTEFLNNSSFFTSGNKNLSATSGVDVAGLTKAVTLFYDQKDADGNPLALGPALLVVPNALYTMATTLMASTEVRNPTSSTTTPIKNPWAGQFEVVRSSYLGLSSIPGYSASTWYLIANPGDIPLIEVATLNGKMEPTIETADSDFNTLGVQMRGYFDFGIAKQDYRAGVKATA